jgi:hypothetical protein
MRAINRNRQPQNLSCETSRIQGESGTGIAVPRALGAAGRRALLAFARERADYEGRMVARPGLTID